MLELERISITIQLSIPSYEEFTHSANVVILLNYPGDFLIPKPKCQFPCGVLTSLPPSLTRLHADLGPYPSTLAKPTTTVHDSVPASHALFIAS